MIDERDESVMARCEEKKEKERRRCFFRAKPLLNTPMSVETQTSTTLPPDMVIGPDGKPCRVSPPPPPSPPPPDDLIGAIRVSRSLMRIPSAAELYRLPVIRRHA